VSIIEMRWFSTLALAATALQGTDGGLIRQGDVALRLSDSALATVEAMVSKPGEKMWLLQGATGGLQFGDDVLFLTAYLESKAVAPRLRRGRRTMLEARLASASTKEPIPSGIGRTETYAQVSLRGRSFNDMQREWKANPPFLVVGEFADEELVRLVDFIRTSPPEQGPGIGPSVRGELPILTVARSRSSRRSADVDVFLDSGHGGSYGVRLRKSGRTWRVMQILFIVS
jgi:hypothetical protein